MIDLEDDFGITMGTYDIVEFSFFKKGLLKLLGFNNDFFFFGSEDNFTPFEELLELSCADTN